MYYLGHDNLNLEGIIEKYFIKKLIKLSLQTFFCLLEVKPKNTFTHGIMNLIITFFLIELILKKLKKFKKINFQKYEKYIKN
jgi:hypothetical protein